MTDVFRDQGFTIIAQVIQSDYITSKALLRNEVILTGEPKFREKSSVKPGK